VSLASIQVNEIYEILGNVITMGAQYKILAKAIDRGIQLGKIRQCHLSSIFILEGVHEQDASKVIKYLLSPDGEMVELSRLDEAFKRAKVVAIRNSSALAMLKSAIQNNGKLVAESFERQDHNKDGLLNIDGFWASLLLPEIKMSKSDLNECFYLVCNQD